MNLKKIAAAAALAVGAIGAAHATVVNVGLELMLLVDVSGSVDANDYALQKTGYVNAFNSAAVQNAILASQDGKIAVTYIEWSGEGQRSTRVGWTLIDSVASAQAFATAINGTARAFSGSTAIQSAMFNSWQAFGTEVNQAENGFDSLRQVIDVSGDGADNATTACNRVANAACGRDAALAAGVDTVNGIYIVGEANLATYYNNSVKGGTNGFTEAAANFADFQRAIQAKLIKEVTNVPEPGSLALVGLALAGLAAASRRRA